MNSIKFSASKSTHMNQNIISTEFKLDTVLFGDKNIDNVDSYNYIGLFKMYLCWILVILTFKYRVKGGHKCM